MKRSPCKKSQTRDRITKRCRKKKSPGPKRKSPKRKSPKRKSRYLTLHEKWKIDSKI